MAITGEFYRLILKWTLPGGEVAQSRCHWMPAPAGGGTFDDDAVRLSGRADDFWDAVKAQFPIAVNYVGSLVQLIDISGGVIGSREFAVSPRNGFSDNNPLPQEVAVVISLRTISAGRSGRGRMYLPPLSAGQLTNAGRVTSGAVADLVAGAQGLLSSFSSPGITAVLYSPKTTSLQPLNSVDVGDVFDAQRRRRDRLVEVRQSLPIT